MQESLKIKQAETGLGPYDYNIIIEIMGVPCYITSFDISYKNIQNIWHKTNIQELMNDSSLSSFMSDNKPYAFDDYYELYIRFPMLYTKYTNNHRILEIVSKLKDKGYSLDNFLKILDNEKLGY